LLVAIACIEKRLLLILLSKRSQNNLNAIWNDPKISNHSSQNKSAMKFTFSLLLILFIGISLKAQEAQFPIVKEFGGIYEIPNAVNPEISEEYKVVVDLKPLQRDKKV